jgi:integrase/recombinase XerD
MKWDKALNDFKNYLKIERNLSKNTIESYLFDVKKLINFLKSNSKNLNPAQLSESLAKEFIYDISKKVKPPTQARIVSRKNHFNSHRFNDSCQQIHWSRSSHSCYIVRF